MPRTKRRGSEPAIGTRLTEFSAFTIIGVFAAAIYAIIAAELTSLDGWRPWTASVVAYALIVPFAYVAQKSIAFRSEAAHRHAFPRYVAIQLFGMVLSIPLSEGALQILQFHPLAGFLLIGAVIAVFNFGLLRLWAFVAS